MRVRTRADNRQLAEGERQIEDIQGAVSVRSAGTAGRVVGAPPGVMVCTVRGIPSRKAQFVILSQEGVDELITELQRVRDEVWG
jgi:hypothetical protein